MSDKENEINEEEKTQEQAAQPEADSGTDAGPSTGSGTTDGAEKELTPEEKIAALEKEIADLKNQALYKAAENDNWRKRMMQQKEEAVAYAQQG